MSESESSLSSSAPNIEPDELTVKAEYLLPIELFEENLRRVKTELRLILQNGGFRQVDDEMDFFGPSHRTMTFQYQYSKPDPPILWKMKDWLGLVSEEGVSNYELNHYFQKLKEHRDDRPFEIDVRFRGVKIEDNEGYEVTVTAIPALLQKYKQGVLTESHSYDKKSTVSNMKREVSRIFDKIEAQTLRRPYTDSEIMDSQLQIEHREILVETEYGQNVVGYYDEAEDSFQRGNLRAALNCYILSLEWTIITYLNRKRNRDVIEEETENERGYGYMNLVDLIDGDERVSQKTLGRLKAMNYAERRWMAHHKTGDLTKTDIANVKERLEILIEELFCQ